MSQSFGYPEGVDGREVQPYTQQHLLGMKRLTELVVFPFVCLSISWSSCCSSFHRSSEFVLQMGGNPDIKATKQGQMIFSTCFGYFEYVGV